MKALTRPDTVELFGFARWNIEVAELLSRLRAKAAGPRAMSIRGRIDRVLAEVAPDERAKMEAMPWQDLLEAVYAYERELGEHGDPVDMEPEQVELGGVDFALVPFSPRRHCIMQLVSSYGTVHLRVSNPKPNAPNVFIEIGSLALWSAHDWRGFLRMWQTWLDTLTQMPDPLHVTRADIAFHVQGLEPKDLDRERFTCRAETARVYSKEYFLERLEKAYQADEHNRETGHEAVHVRNLIEELHQEVGVIVCDWYKDYAPQMLGLGARGSIYCRIYNKSREILRSPQKRQLFRECWEKAGFDLAKDTYNVEFELRRKWLNRKEFRTDGRTFRIDTLEDFLNNYDALCNYLIGNEDQQGWLRMHNKDASRAERCTTHEVWALLREAVDMIPRISAFERSRTQVRSTAARVLPQAIRLKARLDAMHGRPVKDEELTVHAFLESMAEVMADVDLHTKTKWSPEKLHKRYLVERAKSYKPETMIVVRERQGKLRTIFDQPEAVAS